MSDLDAALRRLSLALEAAEAAVGHAIDAADVGRAKEAELQAFADDRIRLAELLDVSASDAEAARAERKDVIRRLDAAIGHVESVLSEAGA